MCGFVGFTGMTDDREHDLARMMNRIVHRGPDMGGMYLTAAWRSASAAFPSSI